MSRENSSTDGIFDGLLRPDEEAHLDNLMEEMYGEESDYDAWQSISRQEDVVMVDAAAEYQSRATRHSAISARNALYSSTLSQEDSNVSRLPNSANLHTRRAPAVNLPQSPNQSPVVDLAAMPSQAPFGPDAGTTRQAYNSQGLPSTSQQPLMPQPKPAKHSASKSQQPRPKWKAREASNATPTLPRGTWDLPVIICVDEIKRPDGEFRLHADHTGNQKCASVLKAIFPEKAFASFSLEVLANRVSAVWNDRDRGTKAVWIRVREMRAGDEELRKDMREKIQATGLV